MGEWGSGGTAAALLSSALDCCYLHAEGVPAISVAAVNNDEEKGFN